MATWTPAEARADLTERGYSVEDVDAAVLSWLYANDGPGPLTDDDMAVLVDQLDNGWSLTLVHEVKRPGSDEWETLEEERIAPDEAPTSPSQAEEDIRDGRYRRADLSPGHYRVSIARNVRVEYVSGELWLVNPDRRTEYAESAASRAPGWGIVRRAAYWEPLYLDAPGRDYVVAFDVDSDESGWSWTTYEDDDHGDKLLIGTDGTDEADPSSLLAEHLRRTWCPS